MKNVVTHELENRMESFFLAETVKYLYLLFDPDNFIHNNGSSGTLIQTPNGECIIDAGGYFFNTEAHPIDVAAVYCCSAQKKKDDEELEKMHNEIDLLSLLELSPDFDKKFGINWNQLKREMEEKVTTKKDKLVDNETEKDGQCDKKDGCADKTTQDVKTKEGKYSKQINVDQSNQLKSDRPQEQNTDQIDKREINQPVDKNHHTDVKKNKVNNENFGDQNKIKSENIDSQNKVTSENIDSQNKVNSENIEDELKGEHGHQKKYNTQKTSSQSDVKCDDTLVRNEAEKILDESEQLRQGDNNVKGDTEGDINTEEHQANIRKHHVSVDDVTNTLDALATFLSQEKDHLDKTRAGNKPENNNKDSQEHVNLKFSNSDINVQTEYANLDKKDKIIQETPTKKFDSTLIIPQEPNSEGSSADNRQLKQPNLSQTGLNLKSTLLGKSSNLNQFFDFLYTKISGKEPKEKHPNIFNLYSEMQHYSLNYKQRPELMVCKAQPYHMKISAMGEMFDNS